MSNYYFSIVDGDTGNTSNAYFFLMPNPIDIGLFDYWYYNQVYGKGGDDTLGTTLGAMQVSLFGGDGNDKVTGGSGNDFLVGDNWDAMTSTATGTGKDTISGGLGDDMVYGAGGNDKLYGEDGNDTIYAGNGKDRVEGGIGTDTIYGRTGNDVLSGGGDADLFVILKGDGKDVILDFTPKGADHDRVDLSDINGIDSFRDLIKHHAEQDGHDVVLSLGGANQLTLEDVKIGKLIADDFVL